MATAQPGSLDACFAEGGILVLHPETVPMAETDVVSDVIALPDHSLLIGGTAYHDGAQVMFMAHVLEDGSLDTAFGTDGGYTFFPVGWQAYGTSLAQGPGGGIYLAGYAMLTNYQEIVLLAHTDAMGIPDLGFGVNGTVSTPLGNQNTRVYGMVVQPDGKVVLGGYTQLQTADILFLRYNADGTLDSSFGNGGKRICTDYPGDEEYIHDIALLDDGTLVATGLIAFYSVPNYTLLARVDADGDFMAGFGDNGVLLPFCCDMESAGHGIASTGDGFLVTGYVEIGFQAIPRSFWLLSMPMAA